MALLGIQLSLKIVLLEKGNVEQVVIMPLSSRGDNLRCCQLGCWYIGTSRLIAA